jgi:hypothetical protein
MPNILFGYHTTPFGSFLYTGNKGYICYYMFCILVSLKLILSSYENKTKTEEGVISSCYNSLIGDPNFVSCMVLNNHQFSKEEFSLKSISKRSHQIQNLVIKKYAMTITATMRSFVTNITKLNKVKKILEINRYSLTFLGTVLF